jgi:hypothetical protein
MASNTKPPTRFYAGDSLSFSVNKPSGLNVTACAWAITTTAGVSTFNATENPSGVWNFEITGDQSANVPPGKSKSTLLFAVVGGGRRTQALPPVTVLPNPGIATPKTPLEQALENIEATIAKLSGQLTSSTSADGVSSTKRQLGEAWSQRDKLVRAVDSERARRGLPTLGINRIKRIPTRFK